MHEYTLLNHDRRRLYYLLAITSGILSSIILALLQHFSTSINLAIAAPSGIAIFAFLGIIFDNFLWKIPILYRTGAIRIPSLGGKWDAILESHQAPPESSKKIQATITIYQTYSKIRLRLETSKSISLSLMTAMEMIDPNCFRVRWEYLAEYRPDGRDTASRTYGVTYLNIQSENHNFDDTYEAFYYTEPGRDTSGKITLKRIRKF